MTNFKVSAWLLATLATGLLCGSQSVRAQTYRTQGAALGGLAGAVAGGIIGHQKDEVPEGALIGGAIGALAGGVLGDAKDQQAAEQRYYQRQVYRQQQVYQQQAQRPAVSISEVIQLCRSGVSDSVVVNHVYTNGVQRRLETHDIIALHQQGVSETVIDALQRAPLAGAATVAPIPAAQPSTVIVRERYHVMPGYTPYHVRYHHGPSYWHRYR